MPGWFYPLMLAVILAGYVFLYLQGRVARREQERFLAALGRRLEALERAVREAAAGQPVAASGPDLGPAIDALRREVQGLEPPLAGLAAALDELRSRPSAAPAEAPPAAPAPGQSPEDLARRFLADEGFSSIRVNGVVDAEGGRRLLVTALRGDQLRSGHVTLHEGRVVEAALSVPARFFP